MPLFAPQPARQPFSASVGALLLAFGALTAPGGCSLFFDGDNYSGDKEGAPDAGGGGSSSGAKGEGGASDGGASGGAASGGSGGDAPGGGNGGTTGGAGAGGAGGTCAAELATDASNCGACGHDCRGAACSEGRCAPVPLTNGEADITSLQLTGSDVVYHANFTIRRVPLAGGLPVTLVGEHRVDAPGLALSPGGDTFYSNVDGCHLLLGKVADGSPITTKIQCLTRVIALTPDWLIYEWDWSIFRTEVGLTATGEDLPIGYSGEMVQGSGFRSSAANDTA